MYPVNQINAELNARPVVINKYLPIAILYFFFNRLFLPHGLLFTTLLCPLFLIWLYRFPSSFRYIIYFFLITIPFAVIHFINGVDTNFYMVSLALFFCNFIFAISFSQFLKVCQTLRSIFRSILIINALFLVIACIAFFMPAWRDAFWQVSFVSQGLDKFPRLKLLTYEPSYYSLLLLPIAMYYALKIFFFNLPNPWLVAAMFGIPLVLAFSFGILLGIPLAIFILFLLNIGQFLSRKKLRRFVLISAVLLMLALLFLFIYFPDNPLFRRISNLLTGQDSSFKGRTYDSYYLAWQVAIQKSTWFGAGLGQVKTLGLEIWRQYYLYKFGINDVSIPNAMAETFAIFGFTGVFLRLSIEIYLFFRTKVFSNHYRMALFIFIFIYQFTGSYLFNIVEYVIWLLAFTNTFPEFDKKNLSIKTVIQRFYPSKKPGPDP